MKDALKIKEMFDVIAQKYDKLNNIISLNQQIKVKKSAIKNLQVKPDSKVLDVCTGTGDIAIYFAKHIVKEGSVVGVDFSEKMLEIAKTKAKDLKNLEFMPGDALNLPFDDNKFDVAFVSFGLRNLVDIEKGLSEMKRVVKEGGFVASLDTGKPKGIVGFFYNMYFFKIVPIFGRVFGGKKQPYMYLPESTIDFPSQDELVELFKKIELENVEKHDFLFGAISEQIGQKSEYCSSGSKSL